MKTIKLMAAEVHALAWKQGWHSREETEDAFIERACNNLHDEVSELHEAWRNGNLRRPCDKSTAMSAARLTPLTCLEEELADIVIRAFDDSGRLGIDIERAVAVKHAFNKTRAKRHGGKKS